MTIARPTILLTLIAAIAIGASAQEATTATTATASVTETASGAPLEASQPAAPAEPPEVTGSYEVRKEFTRVLERTAPDLSTILLVDPSLMSNEAFMTGYPHVSAFIQAHPEVRRNPRFYLRDFSLQRRESPFEQLFEMMGVVSIIALIAYSLAWFVRTVIEQKRWNYLSRTQSEVHTKILDRFNSSAEVLDYIRTAAGTKFLESAPIPLHAERKETYSAPVARVMLSVQIGVIALAVAIGLLVVSLRFEKETAQDMFAMGAIGFSIGIGFIASALVSIVMAKRLGLWHSEAHAPTFDRLDEPGRVR
jgi:hypothetical protein